MIYVAGRESSSAQRADSSPAPQSPTARSNSHHPLTCRATTSWASAPSSAGITGAWGRQIAPLAGVIVDVNADSPTAPGSLSTRGAGRLPSARATLTSMWHTHDAVSTAATSSGARRPDAHSPPFPTFIQAAGRAQHPKFDRRLGVTDNILSSRPQPLWLRARGVSRRRPIRRTATSNKPAPPFMPFPAAGHTQHRTLPPLAGSHCRHSRRLVPAPEAHFRVGEDLVRALPRPRPHAGLEGHWSPQIPAAGRESSLASLPARPKPRKPLSARGSGRHCFPCEGRLSRVRP